MFSYPIRVFLDHKNLVHATTLSQLQRVMRWRLILEEFGPDILHIKGEDNIVADAISRLPTANEDQNKSRTEIQGLSSEMLAKMEYLVFKDDKEFPFIYL